MSTELRTKDQQKRERQPPSKEAAVEELTQEGLLRTETYQRSNSLSSKVTSRLLLPATSQPREFYFSPTSISRVASLIAPFSRSLLSSFSPATLPSASITLFFESVS